MRDFLARALYGPGTSQTHRGGLASPVITLVYGPLIEVDAGLGNVFEITPTDGVPFVLQNPTNAAPGQRVSFIVINTTGGLLGNLIFGSLYRTTGGFLEPGPGFNRTAEFIFSSSGVWRQSQDFMLPVPN